MKKQQMIEFFGSQTNAARALGITLQAVSQWDDEIPVNRLKHVQDAMELEQMKRDAEAKKKRRQRK